MLHVVTNPLLDKELARCGGIALMRAPDGRCYLKPPALSATATACIGIMIELVGRIDKLESVQSGGGQAASEEE